jgi:hypothetical protein
VVWGELGEVESDGSMKRNCAICSGLLGFIIGTAFALGYVSSGASLLFVKGAWFRVLLFPGHLVGYQLFDFVGYNAAITFACLTVGLVYSAIAAFSIAVLNKLLSSIRDNALALAELRREEEFV